MQWYKCEPITDCASPSFCQCRTTEDDRVVFFDNESSWVILTRDKAKVHFRITGKLDEIFCQDIEEVYQCSLKQNPSATSFGGSKNDTPFISEDNQEPSDPGPPV